MFTIQQLMERVRAAPGATIHAKIHKVVDAIAKKPLDAAEALLVLGPYALVEYDRRSLKRSNALERARPGLPRSDPMGWHKSDFQKWAVWTGHAYKTIRSVNRMFEAIVGEFHNNRETFEHIQGRLPPKVRRQFEKWIGTRRLAA